MTLQGSMFTILSEADGHTCVRLNPLHPIYKAHFPGHPLTPGVCLVQMVSEILERRVGARLRVERVVNLKFIAPVAPPPGSLAEDSTEDAKMSISDASRTMAHTAKTTSDRAKTVSDIKSSMSDIVSRKTPPQTPIPVTGHPTSPADAEKSTFFTLDFLFTAITDEGGKVKAKGSIEQQGMAVTKFSLVLART
ncbi:MAG: hypothetical protein J6M53_01360 [Bacteroidaceae bacterium]|nr:hypothetical protein [Bacteroidaceae bacterium]